MSSLLLVHSPIVGSDTWRPVAEELRAAGRPAVVPVLDDDGRPPHWRQHVDAMSRAVVRETDKDHSFTVIAHSGAGQLMAHVGVAMRDTGCRVAGYVFVDAGLPTDGRSRLEQLRSEAPGFADELEAVYEAGGRFPDWTEETLADLVPDASRREALMSSIRPQPITFWQEPIPSVPGWPDAPCAMLLLSDGYEAAATVARGRGWLVRRIDGDNHFLMLVEPERVARELLELTKDPS